MCPRVPEPRGPGQPAGAGELALATSGGPSPLIPRPEFQPQELQETKPQLCKLQHPWTVPRGPGGGP